MSSTYTVTSQQIATLALGKLGVLELGDTPDSTSIANAQMTLNLLIKQLNTEGLKLWKNSEIIIPVTNNTTQYILGGSTSVTMYDSLAPSTPITDKPLKAIQGFYRTTTTTPYIDTPLLLISKQEYNMLGSKFSTGIPNTMFYDPRNLYGVLYVYLTPDAYTSSNVQIHLVCQMPLNDITATTDIPDFPVEWMNCLVWSLADELALQYGVPLNARQEITQRAAMYKEKLVDWDVEASSTFFMPDYRSTSRNSYGH